MEHMGLVSILPAILAIVLALVTKNIVISLFLALFVGITIISGWNPIVGFYALIKDYFFVQIADSYNAQAMAMMLIIGGFVALITASGGALAFTEKVTKKMNTKAKCETSIWISGILIWFTDSGNSLLIGPVFEKISDKLKVSREKFSYILDCTTSPICALIPIIGWGVYIMGLIDGGLETINITNVTGWELFIQAIPLNFYAILTLVMCGYVCMTQFDYGPMLKAQNRALNEGKCIRDGAVPMRRTKEISLPKGIEPKVSTMVIPLIIVLGTMFTVLFINGFPKVVVPGTIIRVGIASGFLLGSFSLMLLCAKYKIMTFKESLDTMIAGMSNMVYMVIVLVLSWSLGAICAEMGTANYLIEITESFLNPNLLPAILFVAGGLMALATGTSWGTYAILMPIGLPMAVAMNLSLPLIIAAIISGGLFGDHCSPISDTTIMASMGAASDHIDHFRTQMPYAITVGLICIVLFLLSMWLPGILVLIVGIASLMIIVYILHRFSLRRENVSVSYKEYSRNELK